MRYSILILLSILLFSCHEQAQTVKDKEQGTIVPLKYATHFSIDHFVNYKQLTVFNPWNNGSIYKTYFLVSKSIELPNDIPKNGKIVRTPIERISTLSSTHIGLIDALNETDKIIGHSKFDYVFNEKVRKRINANQIIATGDDQNLNLELLIDLQPELLITSVYENVHDNLKLAERAGIPVAYNVEWMETSPLARAEWIKFIAPFFEKETLADSLFKSIETAYLKVKNDLEFVNTKPSILVGYKYKGTWYMPGGQSYIAAFLRDAGANYYWYSDSSTGSMPLSFEQVVEAQSNTDIWLKPGAATSISSLLKEDNRYKQFKPLNTKQVYNIHGTMNATAANDYWESGLINPHIILADLAKIFHPELLPEHHITYYKQLGE